MHRAIRSFVLAVLVVGSTSGLAAAKNFVINPQAGLTASHRSNDPADLTTSARVGSMLGGAGFDFSRFTVDVSYETSLGKVMENSDAKQQSLRAAFGIKI